MMRQKYYSQKSKAIKRGIAFYLTYSEWLKIWQDSEKLDRRGRHKNNYVMCRKNDVGPYSLDNVFIATTSRNIKDAHVFKKEKDQAKDDLIESLKQKLWIKNLHTSEWDNMEKIRKDKLARKNHFKERFNKILYNGQNPCHLKRRYQAMKREWMHETKRKYPKGVKPEDRLRHTAETIRWLLGCMAKADGPSHAAAYHRRAVYVAKFCQYRLGFCTLAEAERR